MWFIPSNDDQDYMSRWKALDGQGREKQEIVSNPASFTFDSPAIAALRTKVLEGLHLGVAQGR